MPGQVVSHYRLLSPLGTGGMGVVYRAEDTTLGREVALKFLPERQDRDAKHLARFKEEARTASALNHPHICTIYEVGESEGEIFIAMEYVEGRPLSEEIGGAGLPVDTILRYGRQIAAALEHAHERGVVHRDLKPINVRITPNGDAKVLDFGLAVRADPKEFDRKTLESASLETGVGLAGTMPYMAPEQLEGRDASPRSDIWALGIVLYEMAAGHRPFQGENFYRLCMAILQETPPPLPARIPAGLAAVVHRCLEKDPARRYQRASEVRAALEALEPSGALPMEAPGVLQGARWGMAGGAAAIVLLAAAGYFGWGRWGRAGRTSLPSSLPAQIQLAVLPPTSTGPDSSAAAFGNGLAETLTARLTELTDKHALAVIPTSEVQAKGVRSIEEARQQFGVNLGLTLSVQRAGDRVRVNYSLVDARTHQQRGGGTVTTGADDPFTLQDRVAENVARELELNLQPQEKQALQAHGTAEPAAYDYYLQGRGYLQEFGKLENVESAVELFQRALEKDRAFGAAYAGLGESYWRKYELTHENRWVEEATRACQTAVRGSPNLAEAHACLGLVYHGTGKEEQAALEYGKAAELAPTLDAAHAGLAAAYEGLKRPEDAERAFRAAIALRPNYWAGYNRLGTFYLRHGRVEEAAQMFAQVTSLAPDSFIGYNNLAGIRLGQGRYADAIPFLERSVEIRKTAGATSNLGTAYFLLHRYADAARAYEQAVQLDEKNYVVWGNLGDAYYWTGGRGAEASSAYGKAIALAKDALRVNPRDAGALSSLSLFYAMLGERAPALSYMQRALQVAPKQPDLLLNAAVAYVQLGERDESLGMLEKAVAAGLATATLQDMPNFDKLRDQPRFQKLFSRRPKSEVP